MLLVQQLRLQKAEENKELKQKNTDLRGQMKVLQRCVQDVRQRAEAMAAVEHEIDVMRQHVPKSTCNAYISSKFLLILLKHSMAAPSDCWRIRRVVQTVNFTDIRRKNGNVEGPSVAKSRHKFCT
jgi:hypothetical protein